MNLIVGSGSPLGSCNPLGGVVGGYRVTDSRSPAADPKGLTLEFAQ